MAEEPDDVKERKEIKAPPDNRTVDEKIVDFFKELMKHLHYDRKNIELSMGKPISKGSDETASIIFTIDVNPVVKEQEIKSPHEKAAENFTEELIQLLQNKGINAEIDSKDTKKFTVILPNKQETVVKLGEIRMENFKKNPTWATRHGQTTESYKESIERDGKDKNGINI